LPVADAPESPVELSLVIPVLNEEESVVPLGERILEALEPIPGRHEVLFVDDGSTDSTPRRLREMRDAAPSVPIRILRLRRNFGQTAALAAGIERARGRVIVLLDGDLQNDPKDIARLLEKMREGYSVVCGWRRKRQDRFFSRKLPSRIANWLVGRITGVKIHDYGCTLKAIDAAVLKRIPLYSDMHRFIPAVATITGARVAEIEVTHHPRRFGKSKYGINRTIKVILDLMTIKMIVSFVTRPAHWFGVLSLPFFFFGGAFLVGAFLSGVYGTWTENADPSVVLPSIAILLLALALHFLASGLLSELILKMGDYHPRDAVTGSYARLSGGPAVRGRS